MAPTSLLLRAPYLILCVYFIKGLFLLREPGLQFYRNDRDTNDTGTTKLIGFFVKRMHKLGAYTQFTAKLFNKAMTNLNQDHIKKWSKCRRPMLSNRGYSVTTSAQSYIVAKFEQTTIAKYRGYIALQCSGIRTSRYLFSWPMIHKIVSNTITIEYRYIVYIQHEMPKELAALNLPLQSSKKL